MGSGPVARRESQTAAGLAGDLMSIGVNELDALDCVNRLLMYKSEYDMYATIDAFAFDCESGMGRFLKLGAPPSYILRRGEVIELRAETLPIGIIKGAAPARQELELSEGDRIIMATDGVTDALGESMAEHIAGSESAFVAMMNQRAQELGMNDTSFVNCTGLDDGADAVNHRTSAYDIALMSRQLLKYHPLIKNYTTIWMDTVRGGTFGLSNTNKLIRFYSGATGLKTGFTSGAGYCLSASAMRDGMELIAVVMGAETSQSRNAACKSLLDYGFANFAVVSPDLSDCDNQIPVRLGKDAGVSAVPEADMALLIDKAQKSGVTSEVTLEPTVTAPVSRGQRLGTLTVKSGDLVLKEVPLVAAQEVERLSYGEIYRMVLMRAAMAKTNAE